jgi:hypothetical protein
VGAACYAPYPVWVYLNGHEWAKRQAERAGIEFRALDNGFGACDDKPPLAAICAALGHANVEAFFARWMRVLPSPFTATGKARYGYRLSIRQLELSDTRVFDRPAAGRAWFEQTLRDQLDLGHPDRVQIVFGRKVNRATPGTFQTKVITRGVAPSRPYFKHSKVKQLSGPPSFGPGGLSGPRDTGAKRSHPPLAGGQSSGPIGRRCNVGCPGRWRQVPPPEEVRRS